jgi:pentatricopeptide repeat protein
MLTTLLKVYSKCGLFEKAKGLLTELQASSFAQDEAKHVVSHIEVLNVHTCMVP